MGGLGLAVGILIHREQVKMQLFVAISGWYDELLRHSTSGLWLEIPSGTNLPERNSELTISALRYCTLISLTYLLFLDNRVPNRMWQLMLHSGTRRLRHPLFVREWEYLKFEFEAFPEFLELVSSVQQEQ
jgi:hypothetical protein